MFLGPPTSLHLKLTRYAMYFLAKIVSADNPFPLPNVSKNFQLVDSRRLTSSKVIASTIDSRRIAIATAIVCTLLQFSQLLPKRPTLGGTKFSLTLFSLSFRNHFVSTLRYLDAKFLCPRIESSQHSGMSQIPLKLSVICI